MCTHLAPASFSRDAYGRSNGLVSLPHAGSWRQGTPQGETWVQFIVLCYIMLYYIILYYCFSEPTAKERMWPSPSHCLRLARSSARREGKQLPTSNFRLKVQQGARASQQAAPPTTVPVRSVTLGPGVCPSVFWPGPCCQQAAPPQCTYDNKNDNGMNNNNDNNDNNNNYNDDNTNNNNKYIYIYIILYIYIVFIS